MERRDQEAHTAGRSPSPAVGQAVSFDKALGSTPCSVISGLRKHTRSTSLPVGGLQPFFVFFLSSLLFPQVLENVPSLPRNLSFPLTCPKWNSTCSWCCLGHWHLHRKLVWWNHVQGLGWVCSEASVYIYWHMYLSVCMCIYSRKVIANKTVFVWEVVLICCRWHCFPCGTLSLCSLPSFFPVY